MEQILAAPRVPGLEQILARQNAVLEQGAGKLPEFPEIIGLARAAPLNVRDEQSHRDVFLGLDGNTGAAGFSVGENSPVHESQGRHVAFPIGVKSIKHALRGVVGSIHDGREKHPPADSLRVGGANAATEVGNIHDNAHFAGPAPVSGNQLIQNPFPLRRHWRFKSARDSTGGLNQRLRVAWGNGSEVEGRAQRQLSEHIATVIGKTVEIFMPVPLPNEIQNCFDCVRIS